MSPNPARASARVRYALPAAGAVRLVLYDVLGREVVRMVEGPRPAGPHETLLDVSRLAPGLYFVRLATREAVVTRRLVVVR